MNNVIQRKITVTGGYQALSASKLVASVTISTPPTNAGVVYFKGDTGTDVPWVAGEWHDFVRANLAEIQVKGTAGDIVTIVGGTW